MSTEPRVLFVLQNAWRQEAPVGGRREWKPRHWAKALWASHTGRRLREFIPEGIELVVINASPEVGNRSTAVFLADAMRMHVQMQGLHPDLVVLCGKVAQELLIVVKDYERPYVLAPHPAWRALSKARTAEIREEIVDAVQAL